jgi:hypothetical protein
MSANRRRFAMQPRMRGAILLTFIAIIGFFSAAFFLRARASKDAAVFHLPRNYARTRFRAPFYFWRDHRTVIFWEYGDPKGKFYAIDSRSGDRKPLEALTNAMPKYVGWMVPAPDGQSVYWYAGLPPYPHLTHGDLDGASRHTALWPASVKPLYLENDSRLGQFLLHGVGSRDIVPVLLTPEQPGKPPAANLPSGQGWQHPALHKKAWPLRLIQRGEAVDALAVDLSANAPARRGEYNVDAGYVHLNFHVQRPASYFGMPGAPPPPVREIPLLVFSLHPKRPDPAVRRFSIPLAPNTNEAWGQISPDGSRFAIATLRLVPEAVLLMEAANKLRGIGIPAPIPKALELQVFVCHTDGSAMRRVSVGRVSAWPNLAIPPALRWTPDGRSVSFFREDTLYRVDVDKEP